MTEFPDAVPVELSAASVEAIAKRTCELLLPYLQPGPVSNQPGEKASADATPRRQRISFDDVVAEIQRALAERGPLSVKELQSAVRRRRKAVLDALTELQGKGLARRVDAQWESASGSVSSDSKPVEARSERAPEQASPSEFGPADDRPPAPPRRSRRRSRARAPGAKVNGHSPAEAVLPPCRQFAHLSHGVWRSREGVLVCGPCHPPALPELVVEWVVAPRASI